MRNPYRFASKNYDRWELVEDLRSFAKDMRARKLSIEAGLMEKAAKVIRSELPKMRRSSTGTDK